MEDICCLYARGNFYLKEYGVENAPFLPLGNVSVFQVGHDITEVVQEDYRSLGGSSCKLDYINQVNLNMTLNCLKTRNIAIAFQGTGVKGNVEAGSVEDAEYTVTALGALIPFPHIPTKGTVEVTDGAEVDPVTYVEGTDYITTSAGIIPLMGGALAPLDEIVVSYDYGVGSKVEALTTSQKIYEIIFDGVNSGEGVEQEVVFRGWKIKLSPAATFDLITAGEFATLEIVGTILKDDTKTGDAISKYYNFETRDIA